MSRPSISLPPLPPNLFLHLSLLALTLTTPSLATPFPKGGGGGHGSSGGGHSSSGSRGSGSSGGYNNSTIQRKPLTPGLVAAMVLGILFGTLLVVVFGFVMTNLNWCGEKWRAWRTSKEQKKGNAPQGGEEGAYAGEKQDSNSTSEWDTTTDVGDDESRYQYQPQGNIIDKQKDNHVYREREVTSEE